MRPGYLASQFGETKNLSSLDREERLDQVNNPPTRGRSMRPFSMIKSKNSVFAEEIRVALERSQGKWMTLKSPPMH
jgi:hypothetical protein